MTADIDPRRGISPRDLATSADHDRSGAGAWTPGVISHQPCGQPPVGNGVMIAESVTEVGTMAEVRVLIVDDQVPFRRAASAVVESTDSFAVVGAVASGEESLTAVEALDADLVLMDVNLPGISGVEASRVLGRTHPNVVVILLSSYDEAEFLDMTPDCGAAAYIPKSAFGPDRLEETWAMTSRSRSA
jgi:CheY-like chemotaxis protein